MCLDKSLPMPALVDMPHEYYKVLCKFGSNLNTPYQGRGRAYLSKRKWLNEFDFRVHYPYEQGIPFNDNVEGKYVRYPFGWHMFGNLKDAKKWARGGGRPLQIFKVLAKNITTVGVQSNQTVYVATEMWINSRACRLWDLWNGLATKFFPKSW